MPAQVRVGWKLATGVFLAEDRIVVASASKTPLGVKRNEAVEEPVENGDVAGAMARLLEAGRLKGMVVFGIDPRRAFVLSRKLAPEEASRQPAELLASRLGLAEDALVAGKETVKLPGGVFATLVACPRTTAVQLLQGCGPVRAGRTRLAPVAQVLFDLAVQARARPRRQRCEIRVLPGEGTGMALLAYNGTLLATRMFGMSGAQDTDSMSLAVLSLMTHAREELELAEVDAVVLHTGDTSEPMAKACEAFYGVTTQIAPTVTADADSAALALASAGARPRAGAIDLFQDLRPPPGVRQIFPLKAAGLLLAILGGAAFMIHQETVGLKAETTKLGKLTTQYAQRAKVNPKELSKVHESLKAEFDLAASFIARRVFWSDVLRELPQVLPASATMLDLDGRDAVRYPKKKKSDAAPTSSSRQLMLSAEVPLDAADTSPPEVAELTAALKASTYFQREFPRVTGANVRLQPAVKGLSARIMLMLFPQANS